MPICFRVVLLLAGIIWLAPDIRDHMRSMPSDSKTTDRTSVADDFVVVASVVGSGSTCAKEAKKILRAKRIRFEESGAHGVSGFSVRVTDKKGAIEALKKLAEKYPEQLLLAAE